MTQSNLFKRDRDTGHLVPSRQFDPDTSLQAARKHRPRAESNRGKVLAVVEAHGGMTYRGIAVCCGLDPVEVMRRLGDLQRLGHVRKSASHVGENGNLMSIWWRRLT